MTDLRSILAEAGFRGQALNTAVAIAMAESSGNAQAKNNSSNCYGLFQINMSGAMGPDRMRDYHLNSVDDLYNPLTNAKIAYAMSQGGKDWTPWQSYTTGVYQKYLGSNYNVTNSGGSTGAGTDFGTSGSNVQSGMADNSGGSSVTNVHPRIDQNVLASQYGWALAVLNSDPELRSLFQQAVANSWTPDEFTARVRNTDWFKQHSAQARQNAVLKASDPAEYQRQFAATSDAVKTIAGQLGVDVGSMSGTAFNMLVQHAFDAGWSNDQIKHALAAGVNWTQQVALSNSPSNGLDGTAGAVAADIRQAAASYGVNVSNGFIGSWVDKVLGDQGTKEGYMSYLRDMAKQTYPAYAKQIDAGYTTDQVAEPYRQSMASLLETNPNSIGVMDPMIRQALTATSSDGTPTVTPLWNFEQTVRNDPRWQQTNNARDTYTGIAEQLGNDWGVM